MAGQDISKLSKSSFMNNSPKPKQASILNFFGTQKQQPVSSSPISKIVQSKAEVMDENNLPSDLFDEPFEILENNSKKICSLEINKKLVFSSFNYEVSGIVAPKILNNLNEAASRDFEQSDGACGRYQWLIDIKDINGIGKGIFIFLDSSNFKFF